MNGPHCPNFIPQKRLGQNFLISPHIRDKIIDACSLDENDVILEIGPGKGALTEILSQKAKEVLAIEKDQVLFDHLKKEFDHPNTKIVQADFLKFDLTQLANKPKVIGNLPFNISTSIIRQLIHHRNHIQTIFITVQWEYAQRLVAKVNTKDYSSFSIFVQYYCDPKILFKIPNTAFRPVPKVRSCFMALPIRPNPLSAVKDENFLFTLVRTAFGQRRKTVVNALSGLIPKIEVAAYLQKNNLNLKVRAEALTGEDFARMANQWAEDY